MGQNKIKSGLKVALIGFVLLLITYCFTGAAADWTQQVKSGRVISEER